MTRTPLSKSKGQLAGGGAYCGGLPHSLIIDGLWDVILSVLFLLNILNFQCFLSLCLSIRSSSVLVCLIYDVNIYSFEKHLSECWENHKNCSHLPPNSNHHWPRVCHYYLTIFISHSNRATKYNTGSFWTSLTHQRRGVFIGSQPLAIPRSQDLQQSRDFVYLDLYLTHTLWHRTWCWSGEKEGRAVEVVPGI